MRLIRLIVWYNVGMKIKSPPVYDISWYKEVPDFALVSPRPLLFITKATEGTSYVDSKFARFFSGMAGIGVARGCYHFHRKASDAILQAQNFINTVRRHVTDKDILILDVEEGGETAAQLQKWFETVRNAFPNNLLMIYSRKNILDSIAMTVAQKTFFRAIPVWIAGYPLFPDLWNSPVGYIPDSTRWGDVWLWQYSDKGAVTGIKGSVDLNWINPIFAATIEPIVQPPPPITGVTMLSCKTLVQVKTYNQPNTASTPMPLIGANVTFNATEQIGDWVHHTDGRWANVTKNGVTAILVTGVVVPPPPPPPPTETAVIDRIDLTINGVRLYAVNVPLLPWQG